MYPDPVRIVIVDDHPMVVEGLQITLAGRSGIEVAGTAGSAEELFALLPSVQPGLLLLDLSLPTLSGIEITARLRELFPSIRVIILTADTEERSLRDALAAGAFGYLSKSAGAAEILHAISEVMAGREYLGEEISGKIVSDFMSRARSGQEGGVSGGTLLSQRETEIVRLLVDGLTSREIGERLFISARTVETHRNNIMAKLGLKSLPDLVRYAIRQGLSPS